MQLIMPYIGRREEILSVLLTISYTKDESTFCIRFRSAVLHSEYTIKTAPFQILNYQNRVLYFCVSIYRP